MAEFNEAADDPSFDWWINSSKTVASRRSCSSVSAEFSCMRRLLCERSSSMDCAVDFGNEIRPNSINETMKHRPTMFRFNQWTVGLEFSSLF